MRKCPSSTARERNRAPSAWNSSVAVPTSRWRGVRLPARLILRLEDDADGVGISHVVEAGFHGPARVFDVILRLWFTRDFAEALDEHVRAEFPKLRDLLRGQAPP
jgi:hypothetical protein